MRTKKIKNKSNDMLEERKEYLRWKRKNVTLRGIRQFGKSNEAGSHLGRGLYTASLSNRSLAKQYGKVYFVVNAIPKKPKIVDRLNEAEVFIQKLIRGFCNKNSIEYRDFEKYSSIEKEMLKLGYDGIIIRGNFMVNYKPPKNVKYFRTEKELYEYYKKYVKKKLKRKEQ